MVLDFSAVQTFSDMSDSSVDLSVWQDLHGSYENAALMYSMTKNQEDDMYKQLLAAEADMHAGRFTSVYTPEEFWTIIDQHME